jgi:hypothetical protein
MQLLQRGRVAKWTREKIDTLSTPELRQLRSNAERLNEPDVVALCSEVLAVRPRGEATPRRPMPKGVRRLVARGKAFELREVKPQSRTWSRGGVRDDGTVVLAIPSEDVTSAAGTTSCLLWAPNVDGSRPWSDKPGGQERLAHCRAALARGEAEAMLVYGKGADGAKPEAKSARAEGVDADYVIRFRVEQRGEEFWGTWPEVRRTTVRTMS